MQNHINQKDREPRQKGLMHIDYSFKIKGNSLQFKFNSGLQDDTEGILDDQNLHESTVEALSAIVSRISKRNNLIKIADHFLAGWATIAEYKDDSFASDSENFKKIMQAESSALAKKQKQKLIYLI